MTKSYGFVNGFISSNLCKSSLEVHLRATVKSNVALKEEEMKGTIKVTVDPNEN